MSLQPNNSLGWVTTSTMRAEVNLAQTLDVDSVPWDRDLANRLNAGHKNSIYVGIQEGHGTSTILPRV
jgi:hypothetical protein